VRGPSVVAHRHRRALLPNAIRRTASGHLHVLTRVTTTASITIRRRVAERPARPRSRRAGSLSPRTETRPRTCRPRAGPGAIATLFDFLNPAESFTIDGEAVVLRPDGLSRFEELSHRETAHAAILYAPSTLSSMTARTCAISRFSTGSRRWRGCCAILRLASYLSEHCRRLADRVRPCMPGSAPRASFRSGSTAPTFWPVPRLDQSPQSASIAVQRERREKWNSRVCEMRRIGAPHSHPALAGDDQATQRHAHEIVGTR
jgi:hypothetical protein